MGTYYFSQWSPGNSPDLRLKNFKFQSWILEGTIHKTHHQYLSLGNNNIYLFSKSSYRGQERTHPSNLPESMWYLQFWKQHFRTQNWSWCSQKREKYSYSLDWNLWNAQNHLANQHHPMRRHLLHMGTAVNSTYLYLCAMFSFSLTKHAIV